MNKYLLILLFCISASVVHAQWTCRSRLGAFLKPIGSSDLMWSAEVEGSYGYITNSDIASGMAFAALNYSTNSSTFYAEGGIKYWRQDNKDLETVFDNHRFGFREAFYQFKNENNQFSFGLKSSALEDGYLLNERVLGLNYKHDFKSLKLHAILGTVSNDFARNGTFCSTCYLYDIIPDRDINNISSELGKNNLAALTISFLPQRKKEQSDSSSSDLEDEFSSMEDTERSSSVYVDQLGWTGYAEFGEDLDKSDLLLSTGLYGDVVLGKQFTVKPAVLFQAAPNDNDVLIYSLKLQKDFIWGSSQKTGLSAHYYDFSELKSGAQVLNSFSNILAGEVLRLDASELPVFLFAIKHQMPKQKMHLKCQYVLSNHYSSLQEYDFQVGKIFFEHLQANMITAYVDSDLIPDHDHAVLGRIELRFNF